MILFRPYCRALNAFGPHTIRRMLMVALSSFALFIATNHCALGLMLPAVPDVEAHGHCHAPKERPAAPEDHSGEMKCCDLVQGVVPTAAGFAVAMAELPVADFEFVTAPPAMAHSSVMAFEHSGAGPPGAFSFAEMVLQHSLLNHAPPIRA